MSRTIYIAGPMRGIHEFNFPAFDSAAEEWASRGWEVVNPAQMDRDLGFDEKALPPDFDWWDLGQIGFDICDAVIRDAKAICDCDAIYMLPGWEASRGANAEKAIAEWLGIQVIYSESIKEPEAEENEDVLLQAYRITTGDRNNQYGPPDQDFRRTAEMWTGLFSDLLKPGEAFEPFHVALAMVLLKASRQMHQRKDDNWVDMAGYARCGAVCDAQA